MTRTLKDFRGTIYLPNVAMIDAFELRELLNISRQLIHIWKKQYNFPREVEFDDIYGTFYNVAELSTWFRSRKIEVKFHECKPDNNINFITSDRSFYHFIMTGDNKDEYSCSVKLALTEIKSLLLSGCIWHHENFTAIKQFMKHHKCSKIAISALVEVWLIFSGQR